MTGLVLAVVHILLLLVAVCTGTLAIYHAFRMSQEVKSGWRGLLADLFPYLFGVFPASLTPAGNHARRLFARYLCMSVACGVGGGITWFLMGPAPAP